MNLKKISKQLPLFIMPIKNNVLNVCRLGNRAMAGIAEFAGFFAIRECLMTVFTVHFNLLTA
ncbi:MAG: hypothetical protein JRE16_10750 [Deltaproteobacteria bacterium]|jgi:hypothetical protein|nr:hypothetical protein [Deltaproteobacteria bacterium]